jgi:hypothetical protein
VPDYRVLVGNVEVRISLSLPRRLLLLRRRIHQSKDSFVNLIELLAGIRVKHIYAALEDAQVSRQASVRSEQLAHPDESSNYIHAHLLGARAIENGSRHDRAVFGKGHWRIFDV